ncbi:hypothetical protein [Chryseobacterium koreense]|uniref:Uncharacterized protein n=1 Tax=Chryseobacterium koreense CCUG 49689 TaxID=1304281 RepID=A0A0J7IZ65_9FLAO|nr:hypothetical protein [Chryseobacterium koreense]KMQ71307.1 hypothetical protein ACM44_07870 [Chryseobacterium koreense CCUG 49689]MBB5333911.1 hypothetical protein [Chryseobacterium koreense]
MKKDTALIQGVLSIAALICLVVGFFNLLSPELNDLLFHKVFYVLIGASFFLQAPMLANRNFLYPMYLAAILCVIGAFVPAGSSFSSVKTIGLFAGVILSLFNRPRMQK